MIKFALVCDKGHDFESWFRSGEDYDTQARRGFVECPTCGSGKVGKAIMSPAVARRDRPRVGAPVPVEAADPQAGPVAGAVPATVPVPPQPVALLDERQQQLRAMIRELHEQVAAPPSPARGEGARVTCSASIIGRETLSPCGRAPTRDEVASGVRGR